MQDGGCEEMMLKTQIANKRGICLYEKLGFGRDEQIVKYYLNHYNAYRLKLWLQ